MYGTLLRDEATPFVRPDRHNAEREEVPPRSRAWEFRVAAAATVLVACVAVSAANAMRNDLSQRRTAKALAQAERLAAEKVAATTTTKSAPHIVLFLADDLGYGDVGWGSEDIVNATKFLTKFAAEGITLDRYYTMMDCTPARASLLSGRYAIHTGMQHDCIASQSEWNLPYSVRILPQYLSSAASYKSHIVGKWDLGHYAAKMWPQHRGFESFYGLTCYGYDDYSTHTDRGFYDLHSDFHNEKRTGEYSTFLFSEAATNIIADHDTTSTSAQPLFLYIAWNAVHGTVSVPSGFNETAEYLSLFPSDSMDDYKAVRRTFAGALYLMDQGMRSVYDAVQEKGMYDSTVFIVLSDNGADPSTGGLSWPFRGTKKTLFEGGVRVPAVVHSALLPAATTGQTFNGLFHVTDWVPTILFGMVGVTEEVQNVFDLDPKHFDGHNQWGALRALSADDAASTSDSAGHRQEILLNIDYINGTNDAIVESSNSAWGALITNFKNSTYKLIMNQMEIYYYLPVYIKSAGGHDGGIHNQQWYLFDLTRDPWETKNLLTADFLTDGTTSLPDLDLLEDMETYRQTGVPQRSDRRLRSDTKGPPQLPSQDSSGGLSSAAEKDSLLAHFAHRYCEYYRNSASSVYKGKNSTAAKEAWNKNDMFVTYWSENAHENTHYPSEDMPVCDASSMHKFLRDCAAADLEGSCSAVYDA